MYSWSARPSTAIADSTFIRSFVKRQPGARHRLKARDRALRSTGMDFANRVALRPARSSPHR